MNIVILATRISGNDGVSLEAVHWKEILERMRHKVTLVAGELDRPGICIPELHFQHPQVVVIHDKVISGKGDYRQIEADIFEIAGRVEGRLREIFNSDQRVDLLVVPNALSIPMHFPLAVALSRTIEELKIPTIARHHDFWWERKRFLNSTMFPFFKRWFPPILPNIHHVVINSAAKAEFKKRLGVKAELIWDTFDFRSDLNKIDSFSKAWREDFGIEEDNLVFLQPTRVVPRKRIELSVELVKRLENPKIILVIAGQSGDEGRGYEVEMKRLAMKSKIRFLIIGDYVNSKRRLIKTSNQNMAQRHRIYTLWDCYVNADFITYPTRVEGFGNQFVETMYFKKPIILTPYPVFKMDIQPLGFNTVMMPHRVTKKVVEDVKSLIDNPNKRKKMVEENFKLGKKYLSYDCVKGKLKSFFKEMKLPRN